MSGLRKASNRRGREVPKGKETPQTLRMGVY